MAASMFTMSFQHILLTIEPVHACDGHVTVMCYTIPIVMTLKLVGPWMEVRKRSLFLSRIASRRWWAGPDWLSARETTSLWRWMGCPSPSSFPVKASNT